MIIASALPVAGFVGCVLTAAISDVRTLRIPNILSVAIAVLFAAHAAMDLGIDETIAAVEIALATLIIGFIGFALGKIGGGDVKLLTVCMAWAGADHAVNFLVVTALAGGVLALAMMSPVLARAAAGLQRHWPEATAQTGSAALARAPMPYGVAIAAGALVVAAQIMSA